MRRFVPLVLLVLALVAGACSGDDDPGSAANTSIPDKTTTSSTTTTQPDTVSPDVIPTDESRIDEAYAQGVVDAHMEMSLDSVLLTRQSGLVDEEAISLIEATVTEAQFLDVVNNLSSAAISGLEAILADPDPLDVQVLEVLTGTTACLIVEVIVDESPLIREPADRAGARNFIEYLPATTEQRESGLNSTAWAENQFPVTFDDSVPEFQCDG